jgi:ADP-ribose pyrophosphatase
MFTAVTEEFFLTAKITPVYQGRIIDLNIENVQLPDGRRFDLEIVHHPGGAATVALDEKHNICLLRQYRHAAGGWLWELPAGKLDAREPPLHTARRELQEEAGLSAEHWTHLGPIVSSPGVFTEVIHLYLARKLGKVESQTEDEEYIEVHWMPFSTAVAWATDERIVDAKTVIGIFRAHALLQHENEVL